MKDTNMQLRNLEFVSLDDIASEVSRLSALRYRRRGNWGLAATCEHLADWMSFPMDGFPKMSLRIQCLISLLRAFQGKRLFRKILTAKEMARGAPTIPATIHAASVDDASAVERYLQCIERLKTYRGTIHPSPLFGPMTYDELIALQCIHAAHHLRFLEPEESADRESRSN
ncbi:hypothetical protein VN12_09150 [Pirellula sp. SH-Sr6A]|uniref:DUF1569 domain-containing protein n=1 Tax=Pirellula sp. SH-Sr6A TaxID=1632865 RepID=UPI00078D22FA|nr:DUF1569 domain-containing protein [Pirellula sp. SH-Sr6A]AMV32277.1 hypothetical protein VN12_09150 [Pirellula sp. SH-Sr6A]